MLNHILLVDFCDSLPRSRSRCFPFLIPPVSAPHIVSHRQDAEWSNKLSVGCTPHTTPLRDVQQKKKKDGMTELCTKAMDMNTGSSLEKHLEPAGDAL